MSIVEELAHEFTRWKIHETRNPDNFISEVRDELYKLKKTSDKVLFLSRIIESVSKSATEHSKVCRDTETCGETKGYKYSLFYLNQELDEYSETNNENLIAIDFTERYELNQKLDKILTELENLKIDVETINKGQAIIIDELASEFEELKTLYHLGKKNWRQILVGKFGEMVVSGVVSETVSKEVINILQGLGKDYNLLLPFNS